jgi:hypothetical protein
MPNWKLSHESGLLKMVLIKKKLKGGGKNNPLMKVGIKIF